MGVFLTIEFCLLALVSALAGNAFRHFTFPESSSALALLSLSRDWPKGTHVLHMVSCPILVATFLMQVRACKFVCVVHCDLSYKL